MLCIVSVPWAAETGKIAGKVVDAATNEPIPSVNILLVGTTMGATSNADGEYFILNIPVSSYNLRITSLGYETQNVTGVQVLLEPDLRAEPSAQRNRASGQVTVVAERDVVKRDVSTTVRSMSSTEVAELPITTYQDALGRTAGVVQSGPNVLHIRGGRTDEILFLVDGLEVKDPQFAARVIGRLAKRHCEMQVITAGFNAEYGEAQSAVVNLVIKEGDPEYHGRVEHTMDFDQGVDALSGLRLHRSLDFGSGTDHAEASCPVGNENSRHHDLLRIGNRVGTQYEPSTAPGSIPTAGTAIR